MRTSICRSMLIIGACACLVSACGKERAEPRNMMVSRLSSIAATAASPAPALSQQSLSSSGEISDLNHINPEVAIAFPEGKTEDEQAVIDLLQTALEALVDKDEVAFKESLEPAMREYFDYLLDPRQQRRYISLEFEKPMEEDDQALTVYVESEFFDRTEGVVRLTKGTYTVRKDKDGIWKIANID